MLGPHLIFESHHHVCACVRACVCVCATMKKSARRMASTTSDIGDTSSK